MTNALPQPLDDALSLDFSVLLAILKRNRCAHDRTLYYQRTSMVVRALQKYNATGIRTNIRSIRFRLDALQAEIEQERQEKHNKSNKKRQREQEEWVLGDEKKELAKHSTEQQQQLQKQRHLEQQLLELQQAIVSGLPEIISRIHHASSAYFVEMSRGFFLPLCTVAVAALARIRVLVMRLGRGCLTDLQTLWLQNGNIYTNMNYSSNMLKSRSNDAKTPQSPSVCLSQESFDKTMNAFVEVDLDAHTADMRRQVRHKTMKRFGIATVVVVADILQPKNKEFVSTDHVREGATNADATIHTENDENDNVDDGDPRHIRATARKDDDDIGESLDFSCADATSSTQVEEDTTIITPSNKGPPEDDVNMKLVQQIQMQSRKQKKREGSTKTTKKRKSTEERGTREKEKKNKSKEKKKTKKKKDIFDEIFGD